MVDDHLDRFLLAVNDRIHLSELRLNDATALVEFLNEREIYDRTLRIPFPYSREDADRFLVHVTEATQSHGAPIHFAIRDESGKAIGGFGFEGLSFGHKAEIGYWLAKPFWGKGIMTDVVGTICKFAVTQWKLERITAHVFIHNAASARVLEKNGFQSEGVLRKYYRKDGAFIDSQLYASVAK